MSNQSTRRRFLKAVGAGGVAAVAGAAQAGDAPSDNPAPRPTPARALADLARARFGQHLTAEQLRLVEQEVADSLRLAEATRRVRLENADEPTSVFLADPPE